MVRQALDEMVRPGPLGRLVRLGFAVLFGAMFMNMVAAAGTFWTGAARPELGLGFAAVLLVLLTGYLVDGVFGVTWGSRVTVGLTVGVVLAFVMTIGTGSDLWSAVAWSLLWGWMVLFAALFGTGFLLAAVMGTPGCELNSYRALRHGDSCEGRTCIAFIDRIDRWEATRRASPGAES